MRAGQELSLSHAAEVAVAVPLRYAAAGRSLAWAALAGTRRFEPLRHHPRRDVVDRQRRTRFYYHAHGDRRWTEPEHGHFHLFRDGGGAGDHTHLAALSLDAQGLPLRWFAPNGWVTGEAWRPAAQVGQALDGFEVQTAGPLAPVARWLGAMVALFRSELVQMLQARDAELQRLVGAGSREAVWADRRHEVLASCSAQLPQRLSHIGLA